MSKHRRALNSIHLGLDSDELSVLFKLMEKEEKDAQIIRELQLHMMKEWPCEDEDPSDELEGGRWSDLHKKSMDSEEWGKFVGSINMYIDLFIFHIRLYLLFLNILLLDNFTVFIYYHYIILYY